MSQGGAIFQPVKRTDLYTRDNSGEHFGDTWATGAAGPGIDLFTVGEVRLWLSVDLRQKPSSA